MFLDGMRWIFRLISGIFYVIAELSVFFLWDFPLTIISDDEHPVLTTVGMPILIAMIFFICALVGDVGFDAFRWVILTVRESGFYVAMYFVLLLMICLEIRSKRKS